MVQSKTAQFNSFGLLLRALLYGHGEERPHLNYELRRGGWEWGRKDRKYPDPTVSSKGTSYPQRLKDFPQMPSLEGPQILLIGILCL